MLVLTHFKGHTMVVSADPTRTLVSAVQKDVSAKE